MVMFKTMLYADTNSLVAIKSVIIVDSIIIIKHKSILAFCAGENINKYFYITFS
jgi:hypothetical protein